MSGARAPGSVIGTSHAWRASHPRPEGSFKLMRDQSVGDVARQRMVGCRRFIVKSPCAKAVRRLGLLIWRAPMEAAAAPFTPARLPPWPASRPLRAGQGGALERVLERPPGNFLAAATPAAGKTTFGL